MQLDRGLRPPPGYQAIGLANSRCAILAPAERAHADSAGGRLLLDPPRQVLVPIIFGAPGRCRAGKRGRQTGGALVRALGAMSDHDRKPFRIGCVRRRRGWLHRIDGRLIARQLLQIRHQLIDIPPPLGELDSLLLRSIRAGGLLRHGLPRRQLLSKPCDQLAKLIDVVVPSGAAHESPRCRRVMGVSVGRDSVVTAEVGGLELVRNCRLRGKVARRMDRPGTRMQHAAGIQHRLLAAADDPAIARFADLIGGAVRREKCPPVAKAAAHFLALRGEIAKARDGIRIDVELLIIAAEIAQENGGVPACPLVAGSSSGSRRR